MLLRKVEQTLNHNEGSFGGQVNGIEFVPGDWEVISDTPQKLVAKFDWVVAPNESKTPILVRYRANMNKKNLKISVTAIVNVHGQKERARGRCKQTG